MKRKKLLSLILVALLLLGFTAQANAADDVKIGLIYTKDQGDKFKKGDDPLLTYRRAITDNGGKVVEFIQGEDPKETAEKVKKINGLVIPGGADVDPKYYKEERYKHLEKTDADLDKFEFWILEQADKQDLPVLGICRGHQLINVFYGGALYQDIPTQYKGEIKIKHRGMKDGKTHQVNHGVTLFKGSNLKKILGDKFNVQVNSFHHQAVKDVAKGFNINTMSEDGVIEGIERKEGSPIIGVQFHPERLRKKNPLFNNLFKWLIREARKTVKKEKVPVGGK